MHINIVACPRFAVPEGGFYSPEAENEANFNAYWDKLVTKVKGTRWELEPAWWESNVLIVTEVPDDISLADAMPIIDEGYRMLSGPGNVIGVASLIPGA